MNQFNILELTVEKFHQALANQTLTVKELVLLYLDRIKAYDQKGPKLNSIICINENAVQEAEALDDYYKKFGLKGSLHGVPILLKDNVETRDMPTTAGSKSLEGYMAETDADVVKKMKDAGALILAKTNLHEFAIWGETISSIQGQTLNPYDLTRTPGGSSGGTGSAVAANFGMIGIGTDTINSIRSPASANCLVGIRPTYGLVSKKGVVPYSNTQDVIGPIARSVEDATRLLDVLSESSSKEVNKKSQENQVEKSLIDYLRIDGVKDKRIGILKDFFGSDDIHDATNRAVFSAVDSLRNMGGSIVELEEEIDSADMVQNVSVHLFDLKDHLNHYLQNLPDAVVIRSVDAILKSGRHHPGIKENLEKASLLSTGTEVYEERLKKRIQVQHTILDLMKKYDLHALIYPHQKQLVCHVGASQNERNGVLASVTGFPSICVPVGFSEPTEQAPLGVPIGMEILGRPHSEGVLIEIAYGYEQSSNIRKVPLSVT